MRVLVTGAAGMLGTDVCKALSGTHEVVATDTGDCTRVDAAECAVMDITDLNQTLAVVTGVKPEMVVHCAAFTDVDGCELNPDLAWRVNAMGAWSVAAACAQSNAAMLYVSTDFVFDGEKGADYDEFDSPNPLGQYGRSKWAGERLVKDVCSKSYIIRTAWLYGEHGKNFVSTILGAALQGKQLRVVSDQIGSPTYTRDLAAFIASVAGSPLYGTYHVTNRGYCSWYELAAAAIEMAGLEGVSIAPIESSDWPTPTRRPKRSALRHLSLEMQGRDDMRTWNEALSEFVTTWTTARR